MGFIYFVAGGADLTSFTVASGQPSAFHRSGIIASVAFPFIRRSPSKSNVNQSSQFQFNGGATGTAFPAEQSKIAADIQQLPVNIAPCLMTKG